MDVTAVSDTGEGPGSVGAEVGGQVDGNRFHVVANSHWNRFTREHTLPDGLAAPIVLTLTLPDA